MSGGERCCLLSVSAYSCIYLLLPVVALAAQELLHQYSLKYELASSEERVYCSPWALAWFLAWSQLGPCRRSEVKALNMGLN